MIPLTQNNLPICDILSGSKYASVYEYLQYINNLQYRNNLQYNLSVFISYCTDTSALL